MRPSSLLDVARAKRRYGVFLKALAAAHLTSTLSAPGPFTVFAPTDDAFGRFPRSTLTRLFRPEHQTQLRTILQFHIVPASIASGRWTDSKMRMTSLQGGRLFVDGTLESGTLVVNRCRIVERDHAASNGVLHGIDSVLWPQAEDAGAPMRSPPKAH